MADVNKYLADIKEAVYGEEVRSSIHDAIDVINKEVVDYNAIVTEKSEAAVESARLAKSAAESAVNSNESAMNSEGTAVKKAKEAEIKAILSQSYAVGGTGTREGEDTDNAKFYKEQAKAIVNIDIATQETTGIVKPGRTITITNDGTIDCAVDTSKALNTFVGKNIAKGCTGETESQQNVAIGIGAGNGIENSQTGNIYIGMLAGGNSAGNDNVAIGNASLNGVNKTEKFLINTGSYNVAIGNNALNKNTTGAWNTAVGNNSLNKNDTGDQNTALGASALENNTTGGWNTAVGNNSLNKNDTGGWNTALGNGALENNTTGAWNTAVGNKSLNKNDTGYYNTALGASALSNCSNSEGNTGVGASALENNTTGAWNTAVGNDTLSQNDTGDHNTALGNSALSSNMQGRGNVALGSKTLVYCDSDYNTAVGNGALYDSYYSYCTGIGYDSEVTGNHQIQLGTSNESVYCYGSVQNRSDARDKIDIKDTDLGLDFIKALRPVKFRWNYRGAYRELDEKGNIVIHENDGSKSGKRFHDGLIAQEVKKVMDEMGVEFAGYQDHKVNGGEDVLSIGYTELISPLIKAIQELDNEIRELKDFIAK